MFKTALKEVLTCPISCDEPKLPVITNTGITYEFEAIARYLLARGPHEDPVTRQPIFSLVYNRAVNDLNSTIRRLKLEQVQGNTDKIHAAQSLSNYELQLALTLEEKIDIARLHVDLKQRYPQLLISGIDTLAMIREFIIDFSSPSAFHQAAKHGNIEAIKRLLAEKKLDANGTNRLGETALLTAAEYGHAPVVTTLLADPSVNDPNAVNIDMATPLYLAARSGHTPVVNVLLHDPRVEINKAKKSTTPFCVAVTNGYPAVVQAFMANKHRPLDLNQANDHGDPPLCISAQYQRHEVTRLLLTDERVNPNAVNHQGTPALSIAMGFKTMTLDMFKSFNQHTEINLNLADSKGKRPLHHAVEKRAYWFNEHQKQEQRKLIKAMLAEPSLAPTLTDNQGDTAFDVAVRNKHLDIMKVFLKCSHVDLNAKNDRHETPLDLAVKTGERDVILCLLQTFQLKNKTIVQSLYTAVRAGKTVAVHLFLDNQALPLKYAKKALFLAEEHQAKPEIISMLSTFIHENASVQENQTEESSEPRHQRKKRKHSVLMFQEEETQDACANGDTHVGEKKQSLAPSNLG